VWHFTENDVNRIDPVSSWPILSQTDWTWFQKCAACSFASPLLFFLFHSASVKGRKNCVNNGLNRMRQWPVTPKIYGNQPFGKCVSRNFDSICCISMSCNWTIFMAIVQCRHNFRLVGKSLCWDLTSRGSWIQGGKKNSSVGFISIPKYIERGRSTERKI